MHKKLSIFAIDSPIPANSGARIDIYRRIKALIQDGYQIQLFLWTRSEEEEKAIKLNGLCQDVYFIRQRHDFSVGSSTSRLDKLKVAVRKLISLVPAVCKAKALSKIDLKNVIGSLESFNPDAVMIDGIQSAHAVLQVFRAWQSSTPLIYRSHNREFKYHFDLAWNLRDAGKKIQYYCDAIRLLYYEPYVFRKCSFVMQISYQDFIFWNKFQMGNHVWLPPVAEGTSKEADTIALYDIVILSGWLDSQKAAGLQWFLKKVKPLLPGGLNIAVAGRGASPELQAQCRESGCLFLGEVANAHEVLSQGKVLINAVFGGSGFYMKMLDMIQVKRFIVSTPDGIIGMDALPKDLVRVAKTPHSFAQGILDGLQSTIDRQALTTTYLDKYSDKEFQRRFSKIMTNCSLM